MPQTKAAPSCRARASSIRDRLPHPAMRPKPLFVGAPWSVDWAAGSVFPMRKLAVIVRVDSRPGAASQLISEG